MTDKPTKYTEALGGDIIDRIAGGENLFAISKDPHMPKSLTMSKWLNGETENEDLLLFRKSFDEAKKARAESMIEEALYIVDTMLPLRDAVAKGSKQADVRIKLAEKAKPEKYGKLVGVENETKGNGPVATVKFEIMQQKYGEKENRGAENESVNIVSTTIKESEKDTPTTWGFGKH